MIPLLNYCVVLAGSTLKAMKCKEKQVIACGLEFQNVGVVVRDEARLARKRLLRRNLESGSPVVQEGQRLRRRDESSIGVQHLALRATPFAKEAIHHVQRSGSTGNLFGLSPDRCCHTTILGSC